MGVDIRISGLDGLLKLSRHIRAEGNKGLGRELGRALGKVVAPIEKAIEASAEQTMPSGYKATLTRSMNHRRSQRTATREARLRLATYAQGKKERRDLPALEAGNLRHPVYGRVRRTRKGPKPNRWAVTRVRAGFHKRGTEHVAGEVEKRALAVVDDFADRLTKG